jgi:hypothetical protein
MKIAVAVASLLVAFIVPENSDPQHNQDVSA